jgi:hypothetical protein
VLIEKVKRKVDRIREIENAVLIAVNETLVDFFTYFGLELSVEKLELTDETLSESSIGRL